MLYDQFVTARGYPPPPPHGMGRGGMRSPGGPPPGPPRGRGGRMMPPKRGGRGGRGGDRGKNSGRGGRGRGGGQQMQNCEFMAIIST